jgi:hypothetical protein
MESYNTMSSNANTPLSPGSIASNIFTQENANAAGNFAKEQADEVGRLARDGDFSIRLFAMLGGLAMIVISVLGFVTKLLTLHWVSALVEIYTFVLGIIMVVLEGKSIPFSSSFESGIYKYALFLKFVWGRGVLYFIAGTLQLIQAGLLDLIVGAFVCFVGVTFIIVGRRSARKLAELKSSRFSEATLRAEFNSASGGSSHININQFKVLIESLNVDFNRRELEAAFMQVEKADRDKLTFQEFLNWWNQADYGMV